MSLDAHQIVDRRRLRRKLGFWRLAAIALAALLIASMVYWAAAPYGSGFGNNHIARVSITGLITGDKPTLDLLKKIERNRAARALILDINSPGGTTTGSEELFDAVRKIAAKKPVIAHLGTLAASGGYIAALSADHIVSRRNTLTGSIGVIFQWANVTQLLDNVGVEFKTVKSAPLKAEPNPFTPTDPAAVAAIEALVADSYDWFVGLVAERRQMDAAKAKTLADGRVYTGKQALDNGLVDEIGGEDAVRRWLKTEHGLDQTLPIKDLEPELPIGSWAPRALVRAFGLDSLAAMIDQDGRKIAGLVAIWNPQTVDR